jgi:hypothetical protein
VRLKPSPTRRAAVASRDTSPDPPHDVGARRLDPARIDKWLILIDSLTLPPPACLIPGLQGQIAQLVEQRTENPRVGGSIPSLATIYLLRISGFPKRFDRGNNPG